MTLNYASRASIQSLKVIVSPLETGKDITPGIFGMDQICRHNTSCPLLAGLHPKMPGNSTLLPDNKFLCASMRSARRSCNSVSQGACIRAADAVPDENVGRRDRPAVVRLVGTMVD